MAPHSQTRSHQICTQKNSISNTGVVWEVTIGHVVACLGVHRFYYTNDDLYTT